MKLGGGDGGEGLSVAAIGVIVGVVVFVGIAVGVAIAVRLWRRRQTMILEKSKLDDLTRFRLFCNLSYVLCRCGKPSAT